MKIIFFGLGSIGKTHARLLNKNFNHQLFAYRSGKTRYPSMEGVREIDTLDEVQAIKPDVAFITNPTALHIHTAVFCASLGMHLFIEKPLSDKTTDVDKLESICRKKKLTCYTAYCMRFHPVIQKIRELIKDKKVFHARVSCTSYLPNWRKGQDHKKSYSSSAKAGGGVILDLSHEFDYIQYIFGSIKKIISKKGNVANLTIDAEDFADVLSTVGNNVAVNVHLNFLSKMDERIIKIDFKDGYMMGDLIKGTLVYSYKGKVQNFKFDASDDVLFNAQLKYFFNSLNKPTMMNNLKEARPLLKKILEIRNG